MGLPRAISITQRFLGGALCALLLAAGAAPPALADVPDHEAQRELFVAAWRAARRGDHRTFSDLGPELQGYVLYPYWQYEDYRHRRSSVPAAEMAAFLAAHADWAFAGGLRSAWLTTLARRGRWREFLDHVGEPVEVELQCLAARARLELGHTEGLKATARELWTVGHSQHDACDPLFTWLIAEGGITAEVAWERIDRAMGEGNPRFTLYLARFLPAPEREWLERWQALDHDRYRRLAQAAGWPDTAITRRITATSLRRLARRDAGAAMTAFDALDGHFDWGAPERGDIMRGIALMAAVDLEPAALEFLRRVPEEHRDVQLLEWWARLALAQGDWPEVGMVIDKLPQEQRDDHRWRYWRARAQLAAGEAELGSLALSALAREASYHGFLAADDLGEPYSICPLEPDVSAAEVQALRGHPGFDRALELRQVDLDNWAAAEWRLATQRLPRERLRVAAALAREEGWHDRAIFALGDSGELRYYDWRFPVLWQEQVTAEAARNGLDPAWILGVMRAESAMTETARSVANAMGLMQVTPGTAKQVARQHGLSNPSQAQLLTAETNIRFGARYLRDLLERFNGNPVLVSAAYNAGPEAVNRWLDQRSRDEAALWLETIPYYETRDYVPRVLAFTTIYDWRLGNPVPRVRSRMPGIESGNMADAGPVEVICGAPPEPLQAAGP